MIKVVLVGCGYWGKNWYRTLTGLSEVEVVAVIDPKPVMEVKNQYDDLGSFDAACLDYTHAIIAVQAEHHRSYTKYFRAKLGGSKVLVEKPCGLLSKNLSFQALLLKYLLNPLKDKISSLKSFQKKPFFLIYPISLKNLS